MRVLYIHQYFTPPDGSGGTRSYEFARRLIASGHEVHVLTSAAALPPHYVSGKGVARTQIAGIPATVIHVPYCNAMSYAERIRAFIRFAVLASIQAGRIEADVAFATSTPLTVAIPGISARVRRRIPLVFEVRDLWPELPIAVGAIRNPLVRSAARALEWVAYHASKHVVALSPGMAQGVIRRGIRPERVTTIPNACDTELFDVAPERGRQFRAQLGIEVDAPLVVYAGAFGRINGAGYLVEVAAAMRGIAPRIRFLLVGSGAEEEKIAAEARRQGLLGESVILHPPVPKSVMPDVLSAASIATSLFVPIPAMWNNSANKFFDALAAGRPVAINYEGWQAEILRSSGAGLVLPPQDAGEAADTLARFLADAGRVGHAREAARNLAISKFSRDELYRRLESVLVQASAGRGRSGRSVGDACARS